MAIAAPQIYVYKGKSRDGKLVEGEIAGTTTAMAKAQILSQASTAMLSQANQSQQNVLSLLR